MTVLAIINLSCINKFNCITMFSNKIPKCFILVFEVIIDIMETRTI